MYYLLSPQVIVDNVVTLAAPYIKDKVCLDQQGLKKAYQEYLMQLQPHCPYRNKSQLFYSDIETERAFTDYFSDEESDVTELDAQVNLAEVMYPDPKIRQYVLEKGLAYLEEADAIFSQVFRLVMNTVFCTVQRIGGTSVNPAYVGVMCAYYDMTAEEGVVPELLIHEFTHNALFLDELRYGHFTDYQLLKNPAAQLQAIDRGVEFSFSFKRILHSLFVGGEILSARKKYLGHEVRVNQHIPSDQILARSKKYIQDISNNQAIRSLMTDRCCELFNTLEKFYMDYRLN